MRRPFLRPKIGDEVIVAGRPAVVFAVWGGWGGPRNVGVEFTGTLMLERTVVHVSRIRSAS